MNFMRELCGRGWVPSDIFLPYAKPDDVAHHRSLFKVLPHFSAGFCALRSRFSSCPYLSLARPETSGNAASIHTEQFGLVVGRVPRGAKAAD